MEYKKIDLHEALKDGQKLPFAYIRSLSTVTLGQTPKNVDLSELLEARFFSKRQEIRIFHGTAGLTAVSLTENPKESTVTEKYMLQNPRFGKVLTVCRIIETDEDGQSYYADARLCGWEGGEQSG